MKKHVMTYQEMKSLFIRANKLHITVTGYIVFTTDSFCREYSEESRTYIVSSDNKAYQPEMGGYSIYGSCLDGTDQCLRLEGYMRGENAWKVEYCYIDMDAIDPVDAIDLFGVTFFRRSGGLTMRDYNIIPNQRNVMIKITRGELCRLLIACTTIADSFEGDDAKQTWKNLHDKLAEQLLEHDKNTKFYGKGDQI